MGEYTAPIKDMQFVMRELAGFDEVARLPAATTRRRPTWSIRCWKELRLSLAKSGPR
jgi:hypothetical protein